MAKTTKIKEETKVIDTITDVKSPVLSPSQQAEVEKTFSEAKDFRSLWEKITAPLDSIISETAKIIDKDATTASPNIEKLSFAKPTDKKTIKETNDSIEINLFIFFHISIISYFKTHFYIF